MSSLNAIFVRIITDTVINEYSAKNNLPCHVLVKTYVIIKLWKIISYNSVNTSFIKKNGHFLNTLNYRKNQTVAMRIRFQ